MNRHVFNAMKVAAVVLVACWLVSNAAFSIAERNYSKHEQRVLAFAARKEAEADSLQALADSAARTRDSLSIVASEKRRVVTRRIETVRLIPVPDTCKSIVAQYDSIVTDQHEIIDTQRRALLLGREVEAELRKTIVLLDERGDSLQAHILRPRKKPSRLSFGVTCGETVSALGAAPGCAVGVSWRIF